MALAVGTPRRRDDRNGRRRLHDAAIATYRHHLHVYQRYFTLSGSKMAAKATSGSGFDGVFRLPVPGFLLDGRLARHRPLIP